jgi:hypothetical protein
MISYTPPEGLYKRTFDNGTGFWYWHNGAPIRSVSKILERVYPMPPDLDPWYLERGRMVHSATCLVDAGTLDWKALDTRIVPFLEAYKAFLDMAHPVVELSEETVVHRSYVYGGRLDRVYRFPGQDRLVLCDLKTGSGTEPRYWAQCAGLLLAFDEDHASDYDIALLNLDGKGKPHLHIQTDPGIWIETWRRILQEDSA